MSQSSLLLILSWISSLTDRADISMKLLKEASKASAEENTLSVVLLLNMADGFMTHIMLLQRSMARR